MQCNSAPCQHASAQFARATAYTLLMLLLRQENAAPGQYTSSTTPHFWEVALLQHQILQQQHAVHAIG
jgi:hypothetical protein